MQPTLVRCAEIEDRCRRKEGLACEGNQGWRGGIDPAARNMPLCLCFPLWVLRCALTKAQACFVDVQVLVCVAPGDPPSTLRLCTGAPVSSRPHADARAGRPTSITPNLACFLELCVPGVCVPHTPTPTPRARVWEHNVVSTTQLTRGLSADTHTPTHTHNHLTHKAPAHPHGVRRGSRPPNPIKLCCAMLKCACIPHTTKHFTPAYGSTMSSQPHTDAKTSCSQTHRPTHKSPPSNHMHKACVGPNPPHSHPTDPSNLACFVRVVHTRSFLSPNQNPYFVAELIEH